MTEWDIDIIWEKLYWLFLLSTFIVGAGIGGWLFIPAFNNEKYMTYTLCVHEREMDDGTIYEWSHEVFEGFIYGKNPYFVSGVVLCSPFILLAVGGLFYGVGLVIFGIIECLIDEFKDTIRIRRL